MLGRTANDLFWLARYLERAENMARLVEVGYRMGLVPADGSKTENDWASTLKSAACEVGYRLAEERNTPKSGSHVFERISVVRLAPDRGRSLRAHPRRVLRESLRIRLRIAK